MGYILGFKCHFAVLPSLILSVLAVPGANADSHPAFSTPKLDCSKYPQAKLEFTPEEEKAMQPNLPLVLMYHDVFENPAEATESGDITEAAFREHLCLLRNMGFQTISSRALHDSRKKQAVLPKRPVVLTFDDGYLGSYKNAYKLLWRENMYADFFVHTAYVGVKTSRDHMSWDLLLQMEKSPLFRVYSHTATHKRLTELADDELDEELQGSRQAIHDQLIFLHAGTLRTVDRDSRKFLAYPYGGYDPRVAQATAHAGYTLAYAVGDPRTPGVPADLQIPRFSIRLEHTSITRLKDDLKKWLLRSSAATQSIASAR